MAEVVGTVATLSRFPVKSMQGARLPRVEVAHGGLVGDRVHALVETDTGQVMSAKNPRVGARLLACRSEFVESPELGDDPPAGADHDARRHVGDERHARRRCRALRAPRMRRHVATARAAAGPFVDAFPVSVPDHVDARATSGASPRQPLRRASVPYERRRRDLGRRRVVENEWIGRSLQIGEAVRLTIVLADPRCVMTTLAEGRPPEGH